MSERQLLASVIYLSDLLNDSATESYFTDNSHGGID